LGVTLISYLFDLFFELLNSGEFEPADYISPTIFVQREAVYYCPKDSIFQIYVDWAGKKRLHIYPSNWFWREATGLFEDERKIMIMGKRLTYIKLSPESFKSLIFQDIIAETQVKQLIEAQTKMKY